MTITALPALNRTASTFRDDVDTFFGTQLPAFSVETEAARVEINSNTQTATTQAQLATTQAQLATTQATAAAASALSAGATIWVSGTTYTAGVSKYSPLDGQVYRRMITGAGTTDPSQDVVNWRVVNGLTSELIVLPFNNLPSMRPSLNLDFANNQSVDPRITFTRASIATRINAKGLIEVVASGVPRIDYDAVTGACKGLLIEEARTNLLLNSATLVTQNVTVSAAAHTISFYGTGTVTLSGAASGSLVGSGVYPTRSTLTFTPTVGTLTLTVAGSCTDGQLELGSFATTVIPTVGSQVTRAADVATMTGVNFSSWYRQEEGSFVAETLLSRQAAIGSTRQYTVSDNVTSSIGSFYRGSGATGATVLVSGVTQTDLAPTGVIAANTPAKVALAYKANDFAASGNGAATVTDTSGTVPTLDRLYLGTDLGNYLNGHIRSLSYYPKRLTNAELQALSTQ